MGQYCVHCILFCSRTISRLSQMRPSSNWISMDETKRMDIGFFPIAEARWTQIVIPTPILFWDTQLVKNRRDKQWSVMNRIVRNNWKLISRRSSNFWFASWTKTSRQSQVKMSMYRAPIVNYFGSETQLQSLEAALEFLLSTSSDSDFISVDHLNKSPVTSMVTLQVFHINEIALMDPQKIERF